MGLEDLRAGAPVVSRDGDRLGTLSRVVVQRETLRLTHLVVDAGRSGERVVPLGVLREAQAGAVRLSMDAAEFRDLSVKYDTRVYAAIGDAQRGRLDVSDVSRFVASIPGEMGPGVMTDVLAKAPDEVDIARDSPVWRLDPHQKIGEVERVIFDDRSRKISALVVRRGIVFTHDVVLPARYITEVVEALGGIVRVEIGDADLKQLQEYRPAG
jgi:sporulation protein YlmC with PRC-barrel domain